MNVLPSITKSVFVALIFAGALVRPEPGHARAMSPVVAPSLGPKNLPILAYHDVVAMKTDKDEPDTVAIDSLVRHLSWIQAKGFTPITVAQLQAAQRGESALPAKPIMLTFDDGYASFHTYVLPLLKAYKWPAVLALIGVRHAPDAVQPADGPAYLSRAQLADISASGLVDFANHSYDLHHGVIANAWGNSQPAAVTRTWLKSGPESDDEWRARITADLKLNQQVISDLTGRTPTVMVWPYGRYNQELQKIAVSAGLTSMMTLEDGVSDVQEQPLDLKRHLMGREDLEGAVAGVIQDQWQTSPVVRAVVVRVADLLPTATTPTETDLSATVEKLADLQGNVLVLDPLVREHGMVTGAAFATKSMPIVFAYTNRVAAVATGKAGYSVWLSLPLSPAKYQTQGVDILQVVEDAAKAVPVSGLLVEDASDVSPEQIQQAYARVARWRSAPRLALAFEAATVRREVESKIDTTHANYVWFDGDSTPSDSEQHAYDVPTIYALGPDAKGRAHGQLLKGFPHLSLTALPAKAGEWVDLFSLRAMPRTRIGMRVK